MTKYTLRSLFLGLALPICCGAGKSSALSDEPIPLIQDMPERPRLLIEAGDSFLGNTPIRKGYRLPTGAVIQPSFTLFGVARSALQVMRSGPADTTNFEWANRLDLFGNLQLSGTERLLIGFRPLDQNGSFSGYQIEPSATEGWVEEINARITTLFFEGEFAEIFPNLDPHDRYNLDIGFSVGRQALFLQEGMLINDTVDSVGIVKNTILPSWASNMRVTLLYAWDQIHRNDNLRDRGAYIVGVASETDVAKSTVALDCLYVGSSDASGVHWGMSTVQRLGQINTSFRLLGSHALDSDSSKVDTGYLLFSELSWTPPHGHDLVYLNAFWGIDDFSSAARGPAMGGPLGRVGLSFAAVGIGRYAAPLGNRPNNAVGGALGYQMFFDEGTQQLVVEGGGRLPTRGSAKGALAGTAQYQRAIGQHCIWILSGFGSVQQQSSGSYGARTEVLVKF